MSEKLVAGFVTAAGIAPLCAVCVLGSAAIGSALAGAFAWLGGAGPPLTVALMAAAGLFVYRTLRRKHQVNEVSGADRCPPDLSIMQNGKREASGTASGIRFTQQRERS